MNEAGSRPHSWGHSKRSGRVAAASDDSASSPQSDRSGGVGRAIQTTFHGRRITRDDGTRRYQLTKAWLSPTSLALSISTYVQCSLIRCLLEWIKGRTPVRSNNGKNWEKPHILEIWFCSAQHRLRLSALYVFGSDFILITFYNL